MLMTASAIEIQVRNGAKSVRASDGESARQDNDIHRPMI
jgi:hypothetical protein